MAILSGRLGTLSARDVMTKDVIVIQENDTLEAAIQTLRQNRITGAPVIGQQSKFVGILSISDLVAQNSTTESTQGTSPPTALERHDEAAAWDLYDNAAPLEKETAAERVEQRMSRRVKTVSLDASLVEVARAMCDGHWHRVPVLDHGGALVGIVSTMDILAAIVNADDENG